MTAKPRILIVGGGNGGLHATLRLGKRLRRDEATVTLVDPRSYLTYQPLLAEAAAGSVEPRHVVVPLRQALPGAQVITGTVASIDHAHVGQPAATGPRGLDAGPGLPP